MFFSADHPLFEIERTAIDWVVDSLVATQVVAGQPIDIGRTRIDLTDPREVAALRWLRDWGCLDRRQFENGVIQALRLSGSDVSKAARTIRNPEIDALVDLRIGDQNSVRENLLSKWSGVNHAVAAMGAGDLAGAPNLLKAAFEFHETVLRMDGFNTAADLVVVLEQKVRLSRAADPLNLEDGSKLESLCRNISSAAINGGTGITESVDAFWIYAAGSLPLPPQTPELTTT